MSVIPQQETAVAWTGNSSLTALAALPPPAMRPLAPDPSKLRYKSSAAAHISRCSFLTSQLPTFPRLPIPDRSASDSPRSGANHLRHASSNPRMSLLWRQVALRFDNRAVSSSPVSTCRYHSLDFRADDPCAAELGLTDAVQPRSSASTAQLSRSPESQSSQLGAAGSVLRKHLSPDCSCANTRILRTPRSPISFLRGSRPTLTHDLCSGLDEV